MNVPQCTKTIIISLIYLDGIIFDTSEDSVTYTEQYPHNT